ncbi:hypothetical protein BAE44_0017352 [Dichanthelium oligosanthes]|uniref:Uncharacterized protein n=1 Tax=Dichanthelium oligosanthes TaxID=888268 RepID=A0A1E5V8Z4_9POAL|nr:hypothetical protein BAE44_0017352 [Dichanthelium oligosanthes]
MEAKKKPTPSAAAAAAEAGAAPPPPNGYFSSVFSSSPAGNAKDAKQTDLYAMLNKQSSRGQNGSGTTDSKSNARATYKDGKHGYPTESSESPYFGSSVHYGGREFYSSSAQKQPAANEPPRNYKEDNPDGSATRGDWWQGKASLRDDLYIILST